MKDPKWWPRAEELKKKGLEDAEIVLLLNAEGWVSAHGKRITSDMVRCRRSNRRLKRRTG